MNEATKKCAPEEAIDQIELVFPRIIEALANAPLKDGDVALMRLNITDAFWRVMCAMGQENNFAYVLPNHHGEPVEIVIPAAL